MKVSESLLKKIQLLAMDVDGVLTDGRIVYTDRGAEVKCFSSQDGYAMMRAAEEGLSLAIISGRSSPIVERRAAELGIASVVQGCDDKASALRALRRKLRLSRDGVAYMGDDVPDLDAFREAGVAIAVRNAVPEVKAAAQLVTEQCGGAGAVREIIALILSAQGKWNFTGEARSTKTTSRKAVVGPRRVVNSRQEGAP